MNKEKLTIILIVSALTFILGMTATGTAEGFGFGGCCSGNIQSNHAQTDTAKGFQSGILMNGAQNVEVGGPKK
jgi:hypothetical protein